jgi:hypothetical protein
VIIPPDLLSQAPARTHRSAARAAPFHVTGGARPCGDRRSSSLDRRMMGPLVLTEDYTRIERAGAERGTETSPYLWT